MVMTSAACLRGFIPNKKRSRLNRRTRNSYRPWIRGMKRSRRARTWTSRVSPTAPRNNPGSRSRSDGGCKRAGRLRWRTCKKGVLKLRCLMPNPKTASSQHQALKLRSVSASLAFSGNERCTTTSSPTLLNGSGFFRQRLSRQGHDRRCLLEQLHPEQEAQDVVSSHQDSYRPMTMTKEMRSDDQPLEQVWDGPLHHKVTHAQQHRLVQDVERQHGFVGILQEWRIRRSGASSQSPERSG